MNKSASESGWIGTRAAVARLGIVSRTLYVLIDRGELPAYRFGRVIRLRTDDITAFIATRRIRPGSLSHLCAPDDTAAPKSGSEPHASPQNSDS